MPCFFVCAIVTLVLGSGASSQVPDYETTPFPLPPTSFSCHGRSPGYYADLETGCRTYHVCDGNSHFTYVCPARTLFQQRSRICDHAYLVRCEDAAALFEDIYPEDEDEILLRLVESEDRPPTEITTRGGESFFTTETTEPEEIPTTRITTTTTTTTTSKSVRKPTSLAVQKSRVEFATGNVTSINYSSQSNKVVKFVIKDIRSLFYIPEVENNSITIQAERELVLPVDRKNLMRFRNGPKARHAFSACPSYCDPKFFLPGTCHPCILIK